MALGRLITYFLSSSTLLLLLLLPLLPPGECSQLVSDAAHHINVNGRNAKAIGTTPFICKTSCSVSSSRRSLKFLRNPFINPLVVTTVILALCGCVTVGIFWMLLAYFDLKSLNNASIAASSDEDDFNAEYGIMSRRRIRTQNQRAMLRAMSSARCADWGQLTG